MKRATGIALVTTIVVTAVMVPTQCGTSEREKRGTAALRLMRDYCAIVADIRTPKEARSVEPQERALRQLVLDALRSYEAETSDRGAGGRKQFLEQREQFNRECERFDGLLTKAGPVRAKP